MAAPSSSPPPSGYQAPPAQGYASPPGTAYPGAAPAPAWSPAASPMPARPMNWDFWSFLIRFFGFALIFLGALLVVLLSTPSSGYIGASSSTLTSISQSYLNGVLAGRLLLALGAFFLGIGAGIKLHWVLKAPAPGESDRMAWVALERFFNYALLALSLLILIWVFHYYPSVTPTTTPGAA